MNIKKTSLISILLQFLQKLINFYNTWLIALQINLLYYASNIIASGQRLYTVSKKVSR